MRKSIVLIILLLGFNLFAEDYADILSKQLSVTKGNDRVRTLIELAKLYLFTDPDKSISFANEALDISDNASDFKSKIILYEIIGECNLNLGNIETAEKYLVVAKELNKQVFGAGSLEYINSLYNLSFVFYRNINDMQPLQYYNEAHKIILDRLQKDDPRIREAALRLFQTNNNLKIFSTTKNVDVSLIKDQELQLLIQTEQNAKTELEKQNAVKQTREQIIENLRKDSLLLSKKDSLAAVENKIKILQQSEGIIIRNYLIGLGILFTAVILVLMRYLSNRKLNSILSKKNQELEKSNSKLVNSENNLITLNEDLSVALKQISDDLDRASNHVFTLLPAFIDDSRLSAKWHFVPSAHLGGDSLGYFWLDDENFVAYLLDVSGHGIGAALHSISILNVVRHKALMNANFKEPSSVLASLNGLFQSVNHNDLFFTFWYGVYNLKTRKLKYAGAGNPPFLLMNGDSKYKLFDSQNAFVGIFPDTSFVYDELTIQPETRIYVFSDGIYEIKKDDNKYMTVEEITEKIVELKNNGNVLKELYDYSINVNNNKSLDDDFSILEIKFK